MIPLPQRSVVVVVVETTVVVVVAEQAPWRGRHVRVTASLSFFGRAVEMATSARVFFPFVLPFFLSATSTSRKAPGHTELFRSGTATLAARHVALLRHAYRSAQIGLGTQVHASAAPRRSMWTWVTVTNPMSKSGEFGEKAAPAATVRPSPPAYGCGIGASPLIAIGPDGFEGVKPWLPGPRPHPSPGFSCVNSPVAPAVVGSAI